MSGSDPAHDRLTHQERGLELVREPGRDGLDAVLAEDLALAVGAVRVAKIADAGELRLAAELARVRLAALEDVVYPLRQGDEAFGVEAR